VRFIRYEESRPAAMRVMLAESPTAYLPVGPLGWRGDELPLGEAGSRARRFCEREAARTGGVVFPPIQFRGFDATDRPFTFESPPAAMEYVVEEGIRQLEEWGFERIVVCDGGGAPAQSERLSETCARITGPGKGSAAAEVVRASSGEDQSLGSDAPAAPEAEDGNGTNRDAYGRFEECTAAQLEELIARSPLAYLPLGALEWHGEHGPLGLDGIKAHHICERTAERTGGVVFPPLFWGAFDTMPFPFTFHFEKERLEPLLRALLVQLADWGFEVIVLLTGHYPPTQIKMLRKLCRSFNRQGRVLSLGVPEMVFATDIDYYGDHAGMWESSMMLAIQPEWVDLSAMPSGLPVMERLVRYGTMGQDPTARADAERGRAAIDHVVAGLSEAVDRVVAEGNDAAFDAAYATYARAIRVLSPRVFHLIREALDVHSLADLLRYLLWTARNS
jgi:creatinine amidohydrolase